MSDKPTTITDEQILEFVKKNMKFEHRQDELVLTALNCDLDGDHNGDHYGNHTGNHFGHKFGIQFGALYGDLYGYLYGQHYVCHTANDPTADDHT